MSKNLLYTIAVIGSVTTIYLITRKRQQVNFPVAQIKKPSEPEPEPEPKVIQIEPITIFAPVPAGKEVPMSIPPKVEVPLYEAPLIAEIIAKVSAPTHSLISASLVKDEAYKRIEQVRAKVEACPGAPKLIGSPTITVNKTGGVFSTATYQAVITWNGQWPDQYLYNDTIDCIKSSVMGMFPDSNKYVKDIMIRRG